MLIVTITIMPVASTTTKSANNNNNQIDLCSAQFFFFPFFRYLKKVKNENYKI